MALGNNDDFNKAVSNGFNCSFAVSSPIAILYAFAIIYKGPILYLTLALITTTAMGLLPHYLGVSKSHLMGVLILPAIIIYMQMYI